MDVEEGERLPEVVAVLEEEEEVEEVGEEKQGEDIGYKGEEAQ